MFKIYSFAVQHCIRFSVYKNSGYIDVVASVTEQSMVQAVKEANEKTSGSEV